MKIKTFLLQRQAEVKKPIFDQRKINFRMKTNLENEKNRRMEKKIYKV